MFYFTVGREIFITSFEFFEILEYLEWDGRGGDIARMPQNIDTVVYLQSAANVEDYKY